MTMLKLGMSGSRHQDRQSVSISQERKTSALDLTLVVCRLVEIAWPYFAAA